MKSRLSLILLVMMVTMPTTISAISDPFTRIKTLVFGEFNLVLLSLILVLFCPDLGLFLFDVGSDIYNGVNFMDEGNPIWGYTVIGLIFLPMTVAYAVLTIRRLCDSRTQFSWCKHPYDSSSWWERLLILVLAPLLAPIAIPLMTVFYIVFVAYGNARKVVQPGNHDANVGFFKLYEGILEANFQAILGLSTLRFATCFR